MNPFAAARSNSSIKATIKKAGRGAKKKQKPLLSRMVPKVKPGK